MKLEDILKGIDIVSAAGNMNTEVANIESDSRKAGPGTLFVAVRGTKSDGHDYIKTAIDAGAVAILCEQMPVPAPENVAIVIIPDSARALGFAASNFYGNPSSSFKLIGVTGTNGKTTIATLLYNMFMKLGYKSGLFSTVCNYISGHELPATHTTPDPLQLNRIMAEMAENGCDYVFMEVSSHASDQQRIAGLEFAGAVFTNLTHDHLDYHGTFDKYLTAKKRFFDGLAPSAFALVNADDRNGKVMLQNCRAKKHTYSLRSMADFRSTVLSHDFNGMCLRLAGEEVWTRFIGEYNASNLLAVYATAILLGADHKEVITVLSDLHPVAGRVEVVKVAANTITGIVDYAHTPDALQNVIATINLLREGGIKLITIVGAGGDRDRTKRPLMAAICAAGSDRVILTSDNPRTENPESILDEMEAGISLEVKRKVLRISDRREAIRTAVMLADEGDVILVAGKGHETYQEVMGVRNHFDDREELRNALLNK